MEPSTLQPDAKRAKPSAWWKLAVAILGAGGALGAVAAGGSGTYVITPFDVELSARPAAYGKTELAVQPIEGVPIPLHAEAGTHASPIVARVTITGIATPPAPSDLRLFERGPSALAAHIGEQGKAAVRSLAIKLAALALGGGAAAGGALALFGRPWRIVGGALAGLLTFAIIGVLMQQTYDTSEFLKTQFIVDQDVGGLLEPGDVLPT